METLVTQLKERASAPNLFKPNEFVWEIESDIDDWVYVLFKITAPTYVRVDGEGFFVDSFTSTTSIGKRILLTPSPFFLLFVQIIMRFCFQFKF